MKNFYLIMTIIIASIIFAFSSQPAETSKSISQPIAGVVTESITQHNTEQRAKGESEIYFKNIHTFIRKGAHFTLFLLLGISAGMWNGYFKSRRRFIYAFAGCALYGVLDETRQLFVPGRSFEIPDMLIDSSGALIGVCIAALIWMLSSKRKAKQA